MTKYFISSDVHGFYTLWQDALAEAGFDINNPDHVIVHCGDLMDRGPQPYSCVKFLMGLPPNRRILIRGNHEDLLERILATRECGTHDFSNGTVQTLIDFTSQESGLDIQRQDDAIDRMRESKLYNSYINATVDYYETEKNIFVHGWIPCNFGRMGVYVDLSKADYSPLEHWREASPSDWRQARWICGAKAWSDGVIEPGKTIYCGHWHASFAHHHLHHDGPEWPNRRSTNPEHRVAHFSPFYDEGIVCLDACTAFSHKVNVVVIEE